MMEGLSSAGGDLVGVGATAPRIAPGPGGDTQERIADWKGRVGATAALAQAVVSPRNCLTRWAYKIIKTECCITTSQIFGGLVAIAGIVGIVAAGWFGADIQVGIMGGMGLLFGTLLFMYARGTKGEEEVLNAMRLNVMKFSSEVDEFDQLNEEFGRMITEFRQASEKTNKQLRDLVEILQRGVGSMATLTKSLGDGVAALSETGDEFDEISGRLNVVGNRISTECDRLAENIVILGSVVELSKERDGLRRELSNAQTTIDALRAQLR